MSKFNELEIRSELKKAVKDLGFEEPTPIQKKVIPALLNKDVDIVALAQTGTGKTAAYGLPLIQNLNLRSKKVQVLIISPTRELCVQIAKDISAYAKYLPNVKVTPVYGGSSMEKQIQSIKNGSQIISATPGRLNDLINRKAIDVSTVNTVVLDEGDEILNMGFKEELDAILSNIPEERQTLLFSATMPDHLMHIAKKYMRKPLHITAGKKNIGAENVEHHVYFVHSRDRYIALKRIMDFYPDIYGIVFCRTRRETQEVADKLLNDGYDAEALHGDLSQFQRDIVMNKFRNRHLKVLVATDVAARGLDVNNLSHIINFNLPEDLEVYTHRSGRTGRAGKSGISIVIANLKEKGKLRQLEKTLNKKFIKKKVPTGKEICKNQLFNLVNKVENVKVKYEDVEEFLPEIYEKLDWMSREELIKRFVSVEFNRFLDYYKNLPDLIDPEDAKNRFAGKSTGDSYTRFFLNIGKREDLKPVRLIGLINDLTGVKNIPVGEIEIQKNFTFFEAGSEFAGLIQKAFNKASYKKRRLVLEIAEKQKNGKGERRKFSSKRKKGKPKKSKIYFN